MTSSSTTPEMTDDEIEARYAEIQQRKAVEAAEARAAALAPIRALTDTEAFATVLAGVTSLRETSNVNSDLFTHLHAAVVGLTGLKSAAV